MRLALLLISLQLTVCGTGSAFTFPTKDTPLNPLTEIKAQLAFTCAH